MNALDYLKRYGWKKAEKVAVSAGTTPAYFRQVAYGHRRPSYELARKLVEASKNKLDVLSLLKTKEAKKLRESEKAA